MLYMKEWENKMKPLLIYFSYTGHTRKVAVAERIQKEIDCDVWEIQTKEPYSTSYETVVKQYQNAETAYSFKEIEESTFNLNSYDTILIGTPVWWYRIAPAIRTFLNKYDLSGKNIFPFATHAGWLGSAEKEIKEMYPNSKIAKLLSIQFTEDYKENKQVTSEEEVDAWLHKIVR